MRYKRLHDGSHAIAWVAIIPYLYLRFFLRPSNVIWYNQLHASLLIIDSVVAVGWREKKGYGREVYFLAQKTKEYSDGFFDIKGFLDEKQDAFDRLSGDFPPIISSVESYEIQSDDIFICALGDNFFRKKYIE